jgi:hypothetical protein
VAIVAFCRKLRCKVCSPEPEEYLQSDERLAIAVVDLNDKVDVIPHSSKRLSDWNADNNVAWPRSVSDTIVIGLVTFFAF